MYLRGLGIYDELELPKPWVEITPQMIFPSRTIGKLDEGYEASVLVL